MGQIKDLGHGGRPKRTRERVGRGRISRYRGCQD